MIESRFNIFNEKIKFSNISKMFLNFLHFLALSSWILEEIKPSNVLSVFFSFWGFQAKRSCNTLGSYENKANTYKSRARLTDKEWLRMTYVEWFSMT